MLTPEIEPYFTKIIHNRLTGEARRSVQGQDFSQISNLIKYLKGIFGTSKSQYQLQAELGRVYQRANESVLTYANKVKEIGRKILEAHRIANSGTVEQTYKLLLEKELIYSFIRGLTPAIEQRIPRNLDVTTTVNEALRIEKELSEINEIRGAPTLQPFAISCQICQKNGHTAENCRLRTQNIITSNFGNEILICQICKKRGHGADKCRLRDPTTRNSVKIVQSNTISCQICSKPNHTAQNCFFNNQPKIICQNCQRPGHSSGECRSNLNNVACQLCNKTGHTAKNCYRNAGINNETCQWCDRRGHPASQCRERQNRIREQYNNNTQIACQLCNKTGHGARDCRGNQPMGNTNNRVVQTSSDQCRYCKATGHLIENCVLRLENNRKKQGNFSGTPTTGANRSTDGPRRPVMMAQPEETITELV